MVKKRDMSEDEKRIWKEAMRDVTPLKDIPTTVESSPKAKIKIAKKTPAKITIDTGKISAPSRLDPATQKRISQGEYTPEAKLDLHGFTLERAYDALDVFIGNQYTKGRRCVLVITGKGGKSGEKGLLQQDVPHWLSHANMARMVAFHTIAHAKHGGAGALYVYLKRKR